VALATARGIEDAFSRAMALADIARTQAETGDVAGAFDTAQSIPVPAVRARAYIHLADSKGAGGKGSRKPHP
jgi:hypothetical protein